MANICPSRRTVVVRLWQRLYYGVLRRKSVSEGDANCNFNSYSNRYANGDTSAEGI